MCKSTTLQQPAFSNQHAHTDRQLTPATASACSGGWRRHRHPWEGGGGACHKPPKSKQTSARGCFEGAWALSATHTTDAESGVQHPGRGLDLSSASRAAPISPSPPPVQIPGGRCQHWRPRPLTDSPLPAGKPGCKARAHPIVGRLRPIGPGSHCLIGL